MQPVPNALFTGVLLISIGQSAAGQEPPDIPPPGIPAEASAQSDTCDSNAEGLIRGALVGGVIPFVYLTIGPNQSAEALILLPPVGAVAGLVLGYYFDKWDCDPPEEPSQESLPEGPGATTWEKDLPPASYRYPGPAIRPRTGYPESPSP